tara:strand:- start:82657 stop:82992 length:336 start_codon:yes stop_codon:yes gene_type:complete
MAEKNKIKSLALNLKKNPADSFSKFALALELLKTNEVSKARILFESVRKQDPGYLGVYYHLGKLYEGMGLYREAFQSYSDGIVLAEKQDNRRTISELKEALEILKIEMNNE